MTVRVYKSTDAGAPILSGSVGALISVLDGCLVNGYGTSTSAGWTKPYSTGSTIAAYKQGTGSNQFYLYVNDLATTYSQCFGMGGMTSIGAWTHQFPDSTQLSTGLYVVKSTAASSASREWVVIATSSFFHIWINAHNIYPHAYSATTLMFGDIQSYRAGDTCATIIQGATGTSLSDNYIATLAGSIGSTVQGHFIAGGFTQILTSIAFSKVADQSKKGYPTFPSVNDGAMWLTQLAVLEPPGVIRGIIPGILLPTFRQDPTTGNFIDGYQFSFSSGPLTGKTFEYHGAPGTDILYEISDTW